MGANGSRNGTRRAALVTGASSGIGLAIAGMLAEEGYDLTLASRTDEKLRAAAGSAAFTGVSVQAIAADVGDPEAIVGLVDAHRERFSRLDVLVNNAGLGVAGELGQIKDKHLALQLAVNLRAPILFYREAEDMLRAAGAEHGEALVVNTASITGKIGEPGLGVYSATKHGLVGFTQAMQRELGPAGIKSCVLCPAYVDTPLSDYVKGSVAVETMIRSEDVAESVRALLRLSSAAVIPEVVILQRGVVGLP
jgi:NAD(P)-dependent dehydrogenase (short-subunit alcohol dehydrogenase family)